jgi:hypothetical protein
MDAHVPMKRLLIVAAEDDCVFTSAEFDHLAACSECFTIWVEFIRQSEALAYEHLTPTTLEPL